MPLKTNAEVFLSIVVIGYNEGPRLTRCLESVLNMAPLGKPGELIYVDSDSLDHSVERAQKFNAKILQVKPDPPSPSSPRNAGWKEAKGKYILFLDGDTVLDPDFVNTALKSFNDTKIAIVFGDTIELYPKSTIYHRVLDLDWNPTSGVVNSSGGNALVRREILEQTGGFDEMLVGGEEPDLCRRIRGKGHQILKLDIPMVQHDLNMTSFRQYWIRSERTGYAYASVSRRYWRTNDPLWRRESIHNWIKGGILLGVILWALSAWFFEDLYWPLGLAVGMFLLLTARTMWRIRNKETIFFTKLLYGIHSHFQHIPIFIGQITYWWDRFKGTDRHSFIYKN